jgi:serine protease Do
MGMGLAFLVFAGAMRAEPEPRTAAELAAWARPSLAVISHYGRDGSRDGIGSGFVVSEDGLVATSLHVIGEGRRMSVELGNGKKYEVKEIHAWDRKLDLAVVRIEAADLAALPLGEADVIEQGLPVIAMGNPLGLDYSIVQGIISAKREMEGVPMIQLAMPIEPGNSGGPLLDMQGRVLGLVNLKSTVTANLGFATSVNSLKSLLARPNRVSMERWLSLGVLDAEEWKPVMGGHWTRKSGRIEVTGAGTGFGGRALCLYQGSLPEIPFEVEVTVRLEQESGAAGLVFGSDGDQRHYGFYPSAGQMRLTRFDGPNVFTWTILAQGESVHYRAGDWNRLKVRLEEDRIFCYVNGGLQFESGGLEFAGNQIGLAKFRDTEARFKQFRMGPSLPGPEMFQPEWLEPGLLEKLAGTTGAERELIEALKGRAGPARIYLQERARELESQAARLRELAEAVHRESVRAELAGLFADSEEGTDLFYAALLIAKLDHPDLEMAVYQEELESMARQIRKRLSEEADENARLDLLSAYLFEENGFHGSRTDYYNRANSYMNQVLDDREGLPITLAVLYLELGRRIGVENLFGVALPGHFMVRHGEAPGPERWIDVFDGGKVLTREETSLLAKRFGTALKEDHFQPASKRQIIVRMLRNLAGRAQENEVNALAYQEVIVALLPEDPQERFNRAMLRFRHGDRRGAKEDFEWLLEKRPPELRLDRIAELYRLL